MNISNLLTFFDINFSAFIALDFGLVLPFLPRISYFFLPLQLLTFYFFVQISTAARIRSQMNRNSFTDEMKNYSNRKNKLTKIEPTNGLWITSWEFSFDFGDKQQCFARWSLAALFELPIISHWLRLSSTDFQMIKSLKNHHLMRKFNHWSLWKANIFGKSLHITES